MLEVIEVKKTFEPDFAIEKLNFTVQPGEIFGLLGPNGAGKTTTLRMLMNIFKPDEGEILYKKTPRPKVSKRLFGYLPEERGLYQPARVLNLLIYFGLLNKLSKHRAEVEAIRYLDKLGLVSYTQRRVNQLSKGMQQKIQFITATLHDPEVLILDEPFVGLDPINQIILRDLIHEYKSEGKVVILSTHQMDEVERLCDHICLLNQGKIVLQGKMQQIKDRFREDAFYIEAEEDLSFIRDLKSVRIIEEHNRSCKITIVSKEMNHQKLLQMLIEKVKINKFIQVEPTLNDIFIKLVQKEETQETQNNK
jgi:ABC-2 type transport system ATP-binding protein